MRKKIAVFGGGWSGEYLQNVLAGISRLFNAESFDVLAFVNFSVRANITGKNECEVNFFKLPDLSDFAGVILLANSFNDEEEFRYLESEIKRLNITAITIEYKIGNIPNISTDNYFGMYNLTDHLITSHNCNKLVYIGGPQEHSENQERLKAFKAACQDNGITITDKEVYYADWSKGMIPQIIDDWLDKNLSCPDAFVAANDIMAMAICNYLSTIGLSVPQDVLVTGYDCTRLARTHSPSIASVSHEWNYMGEIAALKLLKMLNGEPDTQDCKLSTVFIPGQSCGCDEISIVLAEKGNIQSSNIVDRIDPIDSDSHFRHLIVFLKKAKTFEEIHKNYSSIFETEHTVEGTGFSLVVYSDFFDMEKENKNHTFSPDNNDFIILSQLRRGLPQETRQCSRKDIFNEIIETDNMPSLYVLLPLYSDDATYGFASLNGKLNVINENQHYIWSRHMIQSLDLVSSNLLLADMTEKLMKSSVTDQLSNIYNRKGCEKYIYPMLLTAYKEQKKAVIMLIDVDHMKIINDQFGHISGDNAITIVSNILQTNLPESYIPCRFGGDEFLVGGVLEDENTGIDEIVSSLESALEKETKENKISFPLTISIGHYVFDAKERSNIEKAIMMADKRMYETKRLHHQNFKQ